MSRAQRPARSRPAGVLPLARFGSPRRGNASQDAFDDEEGSG
jgi:hypothetical protein